MPFQVLAHKLEKYLVKELKDVFLAKARIQNGSTLDTKGTHTLTLPAWMNNDVYLLVGGLIFR